MYLNRIQLNVGRATLFCLIAFPFLLCSVSSSAGTAFFYGHDIPVDELSLYDRIVVAPDQVDTEIEQRLFELDSMPITYLSIGEVAFNAGYSKDISKEWIAGKNPAWQSHVIDLRNAGWHDYLLNKKVPALIEAGYQGLFLDTLDSYFLLDLDDVQKQAYQRGLGDLIRAIKNKWPSLYLIANRGFEVMDDLSPYINEVVAESLFSSFDAATSSYSPTSEQDQQWLISKLLEIKEKHGLGVTIIDYLPESNFSQAESLSKKIDALGFNPWVTNGHLSMLGRGDIKVFPRKVLGIFNRSDNAFRLSQLHRSGTTPLEFMGYQIEDLNLDLDSLPDYPLQNRYAGIVVWLTDSSSTNISTLCQWLKDQPLKIAFFGQFPRNNSCYDLAGIKQSTQLAKERYKVSYNSGIAGQFEIPVRPRRTTLPLIDNISPDNQSLITLENAEGNKTHPVILGPWGGLVAGDFSISQGFEGKSYWVIDPLAFYRKALALPEIPVPDVTTENGLQILTSHIDGDGIVSQSEFPQNPLAGQVIADRIIRQYNIPHTVSVIEGETSRHGVYPAYYKKAEAIARSLFQEPNVEIASHTFSHPFFWAAIDNPDIKQDGGYGTNLPIPGYKTLSLEREIIGSVDYINRELAPPNKKTRVFLWSGDAEPPEAAVRMTKENGLFNVNGAVNKVTKSDYSLSRVWPIGLPMNDVEQIYAPIANENVYTNLWFGPFYGFKSVLETFTVLSNPRRLKPISIYYHFYSGTKPEGVRALESIYETVLKQKLNPMFLSEYAARAHSFYRVATGRDLNGAWHIRNTGQLRTLRVARPLSANQIAQSTNIIGVNETSVGNYVHLSGTKAVISPLASPVNLAQPIFEPYLVYFNGQLSDWHKQGKQVSFTFKQYGDFEMMVEGVKQSCVLKFGGEMHKPKASKQGMIFKLPIKGRSQGTATIVC